MCYGCRPTCEVCRPKLVACPQCGFKSLLSSEKCAKCHSPLPEWVKGEAVARWHEAHDGGGLTEASDSFASDITGEGKDD